MNEVYAPVNRRRDESVPHLVSNHFKFIHNVHDYRTQFEFEFRLHHLFCLFWSHALVYCRGLLLTRKLQNQGFLLDKLKSSLRKFTVATMNWLTVMEYLCFKWLRICSTCRKHFPVFPHSWLIIGFVTRFTRRVPLLVLEQQLFRSTWVHPGF